MRKRHYYELQDIDEVERLRQVRRDFERQFTSREAYFDALMKLQKEHDRRVRVEKQKRTKKQVRTKCKP